MPPTCRPSLVRNASTVAQEFWSSHAAQPRCWGFSSSAAVGLGAAVCGLGYICGGAEPGGLSSALSAAGLLNGALLAHEGGHLAAARALGVAVREFSVGVGPRVAWCQSAATSTTYSLRAFPLFGYVSFLSAGHLAAAPAAAAAAAVSGAVSASAAAEATAAAGHWRYGHRFGWGAGRRPEVVLLEWLPAGRRAVVMAAGVAANVLLAAAFVGWQVLSYGELGVVVRPGALVRQVGGWEGGHEGDQAPAVARPAAALPPPSSPPPPPLSPAAAAAAARHARPQGQPNLGCEAKAPAPAAAATATAAASPSSGAAARSCGGSAGRLAAGDVVLRVGDRWLPAGGDVEAAFVGALEEAAAARQLSPHGGGGGSGSGGGAGPASAFASQSQDSPSSLDGVTMLVLRTHGGSTGSGSGAGAGGCSCGGGCGGAAAEGAHSGSISAAAATTAMAAAVVPSAAAPELLTMDAADVLRYDTLMVGPNAAAGYRPPRDAAEAAAMTVRELASWSAVVLGCWAEAFSAATSSAAAAVGAAAPPPAAAASGGSASGAVAVAAGGGGGSGVQMVGPLGLVASAAAATVAAERESRAPSCTVAAAVAAAEAEAEAHVRLDGAAAASSSSTAAAVAASSYCDVSARQPSPLLGLGIQLNLQLAAVNMLPVPVLDGGQLLLLALEAARGGRRLPASLERGALALSGLAVAAWVAALSLADVAGLSAQAAQRLAPARPLGPAAVTQAAQAAEDAARGAVDWDAAALGAA